MDTNTRTRPAVSLLLTSVASKLSAAACSAAIAASIW